MNSSEFATDLQSTLAERLERGELVHFPDSPYALPALDDLDFLRSQQIKHPSVQSVIFDPTSGRLSGHRRRSKADTERLAHLLRVHSESTSAWLTQQLPEYAEQFTRDRVTLRTEEEAIRSLRQSDALHIDNFADRPSHGRRILRVYTNINVTEPRVWQTSEKFAEILARYQGRHRLPPRDEGEWGEPVSGLQRLIQRDWSGRPAFDSLMQALYQFLRSNEDFQEKAQRRLWTFPPGSVWLLFADGLSHAVLRGQFALEHSFFVPQNVLIQPELSPFRQVVEASAANRLRRAGR